MFQQFLRYVLRRVGLALFVVFGVVTITFLISRVIPSDPAQLFIGPKATAEQLEKAIEHLGLRKPLYEQFIIYFKNLILGDWGISLRTHTKVLDDILIFLPATLELVFLSYLIAIIIGIPLGVFSALKKNRLLDHISRMIAVGSVSIPSFWFSLLLQLFFFGFLRVFPLQGRMSVEVTILYPIKTFTGFYLIDSLLQVNIIAFLDSLRHIILPSLALATYPLGLLIRMTRSMMIEVLREPYIIFAKANGLKRDVLIFKYALKNAIIPTLTVLGLSFAYSITGAFLIEVIFGWPGLGTYTVNAILEVDYPAIIGVTIFGTIFYVGINLFIDIFQAYLDPRVRLI